MADLNLKSFDQLYPIMIRKYQTLVTDPNASVIDKINTIMTGLNATGKLTNDVVKNWNTVMEWVMNDGLTTDVSNKLDAMVANGTFTSLIDTQITPMIGDISTLNTADKTNLVHAVNELQGKQVADEANIALKANQSDLTTTNANVSANALSLVDIAKKVPVVNVLEYALDDGSDQTTNIQTSINSAKKIIFENKGTSIYKFGAISVPDNTRIEFVGRPTLKLTGTLSLGNNVRVKGNPVFDCSGVPAGVDAIQINGKNNVKIDDIEGTGLNNTSKYIHAINSTYVNINDCKFDSGQYAIFFEKSSKCKAYRNTSTNPANIGIMVWTDNTTAIENFKIQGNTIENPTNHGIQYWSGDSSAQDYNTTQSLINLKNFVAHMNTVKNAGGAGIWGAMGRDIIFSNNTIDTCGLEGLDFEGSDNCIAKGNVVRNAKSGALACFFGSQHVTFANNKVYTDGSGAALGSGHDPLTTNLVAYVRDDCKDIRFQGNTFICTSQTNVGEMNIWKGTTTNHSSRAVQGLKVTADNYFENCIIYCVGDAQDIKIKSLEFMRFGTALQNVKPIQIYKSSQIVVNDVDITGDVDSTNTGSNASPVFITQNSQTSSFPVDKVVVSNVRVKHYPGTGITVATWQGSGSTDTSKLSISNSEAEQIYYSSTCPTKSLVNNVNPNTLASVAGTGV